MDQSHLEAIKIVMERRVHPGAEAQFERWARSFMTAASRFPGLQGSSVFNFSSTGDYLILLRFASQPHLEHWRRAPEVVALCRQVDSISTTGSSTSLEAGAHYVACTATSSHRPFTSDSSGTSDARPCHALDGRSGGDAHLACDAASVGAAPRMAIRCSNCLSNPERTPP